MAVLKKLELMHRQFGVCEGHACRECSNLKETTPGSKKVQKCLVYGSTPSESSDWAGRWIACGMFNKPYSGPPIIELVGRGKREPKEPDAPLEDQLMIEV